MKVTILGSGSWGTAIATLFAKKGHDVLLLGRERSLNSINTTHRNLSCFPQVVLDERIKYTDCIDEESLDCDILVFSVPSKAYASMSLKVAPYLNRKTHIVSTAKGFDPESQKRLSEVLRENIQEAYRYPIVSLIGPSYANEVVIGQLTCLCAVSQDIREAAYIQEILSSNTFRVYTNDDEVGCECAAALKNVVAIASGILLGLGQGENAKAALVTRGIKEIQRFALYFGAKEETFLGLTGIGDLLLTCNSMQSRNFSLGYAIGKKNDSLSVLQDNTKTTEGVYTSLYAYKISQKYGIDMPIVEGVKTILFEGKKPSEILDELMTRQLKQE